MKQTAIEGRTRRVRERALDPVSRASEVLFGLIMVLTFTNTFGAATAERADVRLMIAGALGCNVAWGIIDAIFYLMGMVGDRAIGKRTVAAVVSHADPAQARALIVDAMPPVLRDTLDQRDYERMRQALVRKPLDQLQPWPVRQDWLAAFGVFLLVFLSTLPVVLPFVVVRDAVLALRISNGVAMGLLFLTGYAFGREAGRPILIGLAMVLIGTLLVAMTNALGG